MKIPEIIRKELDACGLPWEIIPGHGSHAKLFICGRYVGVFAVNHSKSHAGRGGLNVRAQIRRVVAEIKGGKP